MTAPFEVSGTEPVPAHLHLSQAQFDHLRALLRAQLAEQDEALCEHHDTLDDATHDVVDAAVTSERELAEAYVAFARTAAVDLQQALVRFGDGTYGSCEGCGAPIPYERLEAIPETRFCVHCPRARGLFG